MRRAVWGLLLLAGCTCGEDAPASEPQAATEATEASEEAEPQQREGDPFDDTDRFQVYGYDLSPYGAALGTWRSVETDGSELVRTVARNSEGHALLTASLDGEAQVSIHIVEDATYTMRRDRCIVSNQDVARAMRTIPRRIPLNRVEVPVYGLLGDGVPDESAEPIEGDAPEGSLGVRGRRFSYERSISLYQASVEGEVWVDAEDRPVHSKGKLTLTPEAGEDAPQTATWEFTVEPGDEVKVAPPEGCERVVEQVVIMKAIPRMEGHEVALASPNNVVYRAPGTVDEAMAHYREVMGKDGWKEERSEIHPQTGTLLFFRDDQRFKVIARRADEGSLTIFMNFAR
jgi:hypothetical protein